MKLSIAVRVLTEYLGMMREVNSDESRAALKALSALAPVTPDVSGGVQQSEVASLIASMQPTRPAASAPNQLGFAPPAPRVMLGR